MIPMEEPPLELISNVAEDHRLYVVGWWNSLTTPQKRSLAELLAASGRTIAVVDESASGRESVDVSKEDNTTDDWQKVWEDEWETDWQEYLTAHPEVVFLSMKTRLSSN